MVSIEYGGGPTIEQRRAFSSLKEGSHIPGYLGFTPQLKYQCGNTYGKQTHLISQKLPYYSGPTDQTVCHITPQITAVGCQKGPVFEDEVQLKMLPISKGDNKYIENLMPGYSGDIPRLPFKHGKRYTVLANRSIHEFVQSNIDRKKEIDEIHRISRYFPRMEPVRKDEEVRDNTNLWVDNLLKKDALPPHRAPTEAPIPRYMGYVPRSRVTELNLGNRYKVGSERSLKVFSEENKRHFDELKTPGVPCSQREVSQTLRLKPSDEDEVNSRVYHQTGCIPNYTGHVHQNRYQLGNTYGETTRNLDSCYHDYSSYGNYLRSQPPPKYKIKFK